MKRFAKLAIAAVVVVVAAPAYAGQQERHFCQGFATYLDASGFGDSLPTAEERNSCTITFNPLYYSEADQTNDAPWYLRCLGSTFAGTVDCGHYDPIVPITATSDSQLN